MFSHRHWWEPCRSAHAHPAELPFRVSGTWAWIPWNVYTEPWKKHSSFNSACTEELGSPRGGDAVDSDLAPRSLPSHTTGTESRRKPNSHMVSETNMMRSKGSLKRDLKNYALCSYCSIHPWATWLHMMPMQTQSPSIWACLNIPTVNHKHHTMRSVLFKFPQHFPQLTNRPLWCIPRPAFLFISACLCKAQTLSSG